MNYCINCGDRPTDQNSRYCTKCGGRVIKVIEKKPKEPEPKK
jgi:rRNA maturation endonuclease Nob1